MWNAKNGTKNLDDAHSCRASRTAQLMAAKWEVEKPVKNAFSYRRYKYRSLNISTDRYIESFYFRSVGTNKLEFFLHPMTQ